MNKNNNFSNSINTNTNRLIIPNSNKYRMDRKILSIHSEDRDINKWPNSNEFSIQCPQTYENVEYIELLSCHFPSTQDVFSNEYQNTKIAFKIIDIDPSSSFFPYYDPNYIFQIQIQDGNYTGQDISMEIQNRMNDAVNDFMNTQSGNTTPTYNDFKIYHDYVGNIFYFGNQYAKFILLFDNQLTYTTKCNQPTMFNNYSNWGLPWNLGFDKKQYISTSQLLSDGDKGIKFYYISDISSSLWLPASASLFPSYYVKAPYNFKNTGDLAIYMELEKMNYLDELEPYSVSTTSTKNNDFGGKVNSAFIKIYISSNSNSYMLDTISMYLNNCGYNSPPLEKVSRLKFKFRYHDGRLVDFKNMPFHFNLQINQLTPDYITNYRPSDYEIR
jgi:hypothetical protein